MISAYYNIFLFLFLRLLFTVNGEFLIFLEFETFNFILIFYQMDHHVVDIMPIFVRNLILLVLKISFLQIRKGLILKAWRT